MAMKKAVKTKKRTLKALRDLVPKKKTMGGRGVK
jgi:hypothetical protein